MNKDYISTEQFASLLTEIHQKLEMGKVAECDDMLRQILSDTQSQESYIDRTYIGNLKEKKRISKMADINRMLTEMSLEQIDNVHKYASDEYDEPNHEAEALEAIMELSRKNKPEKQDG